MTVYKIINPSDPYHLTADDLVLAAIAACLLGHGKYALEATDGSEGVQLFLFGGHDEWFAAQGAGSFDAALTAATGQRAEALSKVLESVTIVGTRSSLNDIGEAAARLAVGVRKMVAQAHERTPYDAMGPVDAPNPPAVRASLADVQPGGRVRLEQEPREHRWDDVGERCIDCGDKDWMGGACSGPRAPEITSPWSPIGMAPSDGEQHIRGLWVTSRVDGKPDTREWRQFIGLVNDDGAFVDPEYGETFGWEADEYDAWMPVAAAPDAAISAQPSPGGQGEAPRCFVSLDMLAGSRHKFGEVFDHPQGSFVRYEDHVRALAARQPVGEPFAYGSSTGHQPIPASIYRPNSDSCRELYDIPLYAAPPQAVDVGQFRQAVVHWYADAENANTNPAWVREEADRLLALIDSQAVGK